MQPISVNIGNTDIVPLAAFCSASDYWYCKNFGSITWPGAQTLKVPYSNLNVTDRTKLSFQLGGDKGSPFLGGVYGYDSNDYFQMDYYGMNTAMPYRCGIVMFGPSSFYTGAPSGLPKVVAVIANNSNNPASAADVQLGGHCLNNNTFEFDSPLTSNLYGVYGFVSNPDSGGLYGGAIIRSYTYTTTGFQFNTYAVNGSTGSQTAFNNSNFQMVVVQ